LIKKNKKKHLSFSLMLDSSERSAEQQVLHTAVRKQQFRKHQWGYACRQHVDRWSH